ncbi:MAG TPA: UPF0149 family protein [Gammaproteobacteria bacterium]|jgi:uncharacterized protein YgfB (UPF0149 family)
MNFDSLQSVLTELSSKYHASEWHGVLCGLLCAGHQGPAGQWYEIVAEINSEAVTADERVRSALDKIYKQTRMQLNDVDLGFQLLLPGDNVPLADRTAALSRWCESFLYGLSYGGVDRQAKLPGDASETLADLVEISRFEFDANSIDPDDEYHYAELVEYVRVAIMLLNEELNPVVPARQKLH